MQAAVSVESELLRLLRPVERERLQDMEIAPVINVTRRASSLQRCGNCNGSQSYHCSWRRHAPN